MPHGTRANSDSPGPLDRQAFVPGLRTEHEVRLAGLAPATRYAYAIGSSSGDLSAGDDHRFTTPPLPGTRQPVRIWAFGDSGDTSRSRCATPSARCSRAATACPRAAAFASTDRPGAAHGAAEPPAGPARFEA
jgi:hypothetical protein